MNFRIIKSSAKNVPDVLLFRDRNDLGEELVSINTIGYNVDDESDDYFESDIINFGDSTENAQAFIRDFSELSASEWTVMKNIIRR